ncbi:Acyl-coenzyme A thioesterase PaaI [Pigmentiphaga humi]|uniref:Acyl-coenzyme A thioesterase PaaI n=1 Tax=Pigmentiphaga humi TaxID=2478468 RepID=A0A3P4B0A1_9BURK|nr:PaaI family thioesterase [Pigmentiphaga humi]VCU69729.1 Acyl-coenzyme A thioesterase PaaI [Pigmentiphaga humi]
MPADTPQTVTGVSIPFLEWLGARLVKAEGGVSEVRMAILPEHRNSWQVCHGGVLMTLLDAAMATAARSLHPELRGSATVDMTTSFVRPGQSDTLFATGKCYHRSTTMAFCEGEVRDEAGELVARSSGTFKYIKKRSEQGVDG